MFRTPLFPRCRPRHQVSFRRPFPLSVYTLVDNWSECEARLADEDETDEVYLHKFYAKCGGLVGAKEWAKDEIERAENTRNADEVRDAIEKPEIPEPPSKKARTGAASASSSQGGGDGKAAVASTPPKMVSLRATRKAGALTDSGRKAGKNGKKK